MNRKSDYGAIFDVDGTLVDSHEAHFRAWSETLDGSGIEYGADDFRRDFGRRNPEIIEAVWNTSGRGDPDPVLVANLAEEKERRFRDLLAADFPEMTGAAALLRGLDHAGWSVAIGSSAPSENVDLSLTMLGVEDVVDEVVSGDDVDRGKPEPDVFLEAARRLGLPPERCIVIEDAPSGVESAHRAGMRAVAIASTGRTRMELEAAELVIESLGEIDHERLERIIKEGNA